MEFYEMSVLLDHIDLKDRNDWERTRFSSYVQAQTQSTKQLKPQDIMKFPWEKEEKVIDTEDDLREMEKMLKEYTTKLNTHE